MEDDVRFDWKFVVSVRCFTSLQASLFISALSQTLSLATSPRSRTTCTCKDIVSWSRILSLLYICHSAHLEHWKETEPLGGLLGSATKMVIIIYV